MKNNKARFVFLAILMSLTRVSFAAVFPGELDAPLDRFVRHIINGEFPASFAIADSITLSRTGEPVGPLLRLLALGMRDLDYDRPIDTVDFLLTYKKTTAAISAYEKNHGQSSFSMTMAGFANATHAAYYLRRKQYFSAIGTGLEAIKLLDKAKQADSMNFEADFFLGLYEYAKAELRARLWMVLFWYGGDKYAGIAHLNRCASHRNIAATAARMSLADIYIQEKEYDKAKVEIDYLLAEFPRSRFVIWTYAKYLSAREDFSGAARCFADLSRLYASSPLGKHNSLVTWRRQIQLLCRAGLSGDARQEAQKMLDGDCRNPPWQKSAPCMEVRAMKEKGVCDGSDNTP